MADTIKFCAHCQEKTDHTTITEGRLHICAVCGTEQQFKPGEKGPAPRVPKDVPLVHRTSDLFHPEAQSSREERSSFQNKQEGTRMGKLTAENKADIIRRHEAGEKSSVLASEFGCSENAIYYTISKAGKKGKKEKPESRKAGKPESRKAGKPESTGSIRDAVARMVAEQVDAHLADLDTRIEQVVVRMLK